MTRNHLGKILAIGIICLFIGVGIHPAFAVDTKQSVVNKASEDDCGCNEVDDRQLVVLENQLNKLEVYSKLIYVFSKHNPELKEISKELSTGISTLKGLFEELNLNPSPADDSFICDILLLIGVSIAGTMLSLDYLLDKCLENGNEILANILTLIVDVLLLALVGIIFSGYFYDCEWQIEPPS